jgi:hypothetical protein
MTEERDLSEICEAEFNTFTTAIKKMGFDHHGFVYALLINSEAFDKNIMVDFNLSEEESKAIENRIHLLS